MNITKNKNINRLALIGVMVAFATFAFTTPVSVKLEEYNWYEANESAGTIGNPIDVDAVCTDQGELCAVGFSRSHYNLSPSDPAPIDNMEDLQDEDDTNYQLAEKPVTR